MIAPFTSASSIMLLPILHLGWPPRISLHNKIQCLWIWNGMHAEQTYLSRLHAMHVHWTWNRWRTDLSFTLQQGSMISNLAAILASQPSTTEFRYTIGVFPINWFPSNQTHTIHPALCFLVIKPKPLFSKTPGYYWTIVHHHVWRCSSSSNKKRLRPHKYYTENINIVLPPLLSNKDSPPLSKIGCAHRHISRIVNRIQNSDLSIAETGGKKQEKQFLKRTKIRVHQKKTKKTGHTCVTSSAMLRWYSTSLSVSTETAWLTTDLFT